MRQGKGQRQQKLRLPISIQTFSEVRESGCYYMDKTAYIERLADGGKSYFLSRPHRFGKSLFLDTIEEAFKCSRELFEWLTIHDRGGTDLKRRHQATFEIITIHYRWDWPAPRPALGTSCGGAAGGRV